MLVISLSLLFLCVNSLDNGLARKPPMGWMSWAAFYCETDCTVHPNGCINENLYMEMADSLANDGYRDAGYESIHIDDCWTEMQRVNGKLSANASRFPSGIKALAKYMHDRNLKLGIYADVGSETCAGYPGSAGFEEVDAETFAEWDVDYLKYDGCNSNMPDLRKGYKTMRYALNATGKHITYGCEWPLYLTVHHQKIHYKKIAGNCNVFRNYFDVDSSWESITGIIKFYDQSQDQMIPYHGPGHWFDPDMLVIGNKKVTEDMARSQMTIWSIWSAPLIMSTDLRAIAPEFKKILLNKKVIAIDQDPLGVMGRLIANKNDIGIYTKKVTPTIDGRFSYAIGVLNRNGTHAKRVTFRFKELGLEDEMGYFVEDLWTDKNLGHFFKGDKLRVDLSPAGSSLFNAILADLL